MKLLALRFYLYTFFNDYVNNSSNVGTPTAANLLEIVIFL